jgi:hypothetical protein
MITIEADVAATMVLTLRSVKPPFITSFAAQLLNETDQVVRANVASVDSFPPQETK